MVYQGSNYELLTILDINNEKTHVVSNSNTTDMTIIWNRGKVMKIAVDKVDFHLLKNEIIFLSSFHKVENITLESARMIRFNQPFFCVFDKDHETGSNGLQFFRNPGIPIVSISESQLLSFEISWELFCSEMQANDNLQKEMLLSILKRMVILCARNLKACNSFSEMKANRADIIRKFNFLVEDHFLKHHDVAFYASKLNKSPKTLSNLFSSLSDRAPISIIHDRIMMHARKQINHTQLSIKEIAYDLGYEDIQTFSRFFKNKEGISPSHYRAKNYKGLHLIT